MCYVASLGSAKAKKCGGSLLLTAGVNSRRVTFEVTLASGRTIDTLDLGISYLVPLPGNEVTPEIYYLGTLDLVALRFSTLRKG